MLSGVKLICPSDSLIILRLPNEGISMRFAVIGNRGMLGSEMMLFLADQGHEVLGFNRENLNLDDSVESIARRLDDFDAVVNAVAYTAVDKAESETELANLVNGNYAGKLAEASKIAGGKFLHVSTDYVFDGNSETPYATDAKPNPQGAYGRSKLLGEDLVNESGANFTIFRTAWLYGAHGRCFPKVMREKALLGDPLRVVNDQFGQPTWTRDLAEQIISYAQLDNAPAIVHCVSSGKASWFDFATEVVGDYQIEPVSSGEFVTAAKRPKYSVLHNSSDLVAPIGDWKQRWLAAKDDVLGLLK
jgi:dTDP-4-dehydrorhamnose reductase